MGNHEQRSEEAMNDERRKRARDIFWSVAPDVKLQDAIIDAMLVFADEEIERASRPFVPKASSLEIFLRTGNLDAARKP